MPFRPRRPKHGHTQSDKSVIPEIDYSTARCEVQHPDSDKDICDRPVEWLCVYRCCNDMARMCDGHKAVKEAEEAALIKAFDGQPITCGPCGTSPMPPVQFHQI